MEKVSEVIGLVRPDIKFRGRSHLGRVGWKSTYYNSGASGMISVV